MLNIFGFSLILCNRNWIMLENTKRETPQQDSGQWARARVWVGPETPCGCVSASEIPQDFWSKTGPTFIQCFQCGRRWTRETWPEGFPPVKPSPQATAKQEAQNISSRTSSTS